MEQDKGIRLQSSKEIKKKLTKGATVKRSMSNPKVSGHSQEKKETLDTLADIIVNIILSNGERS